MTFLTFAVVGAIFFPLFSAAISGAFLSRFSSRNIQILTCFGVGLSFFAALFLIAPIFLEGGIFSLKLLDWIVVGGKHYSWSLYIDKPSLIMVLMVSFVSFFVHIYSIGYMAKDTSLPRFMVYLNLFTFAMLMLVTAGNLLQLFFGWEGVGLCSYLLIGFWYEKPSAVLASLKAFLMNRIGDFGILLGIVGLIWAAGSIEVVDILEMTPASFPVFSAFGTEVNSLTVITLFLFLGAMGKSAQFGIHTWLPDAMEGPTPVSALIHAATMVTAGVFLIVRTYPLFEAAPYTLSVILSIGMLTAFFAATVALVQTDIKKVIAYSTCSQLGFMFMALGVKAWGVALFHLLTHAFFKALLFLGAGSVIHALHHEQDMTKMGGLWKKLPLTHAMMVIGALALTGIPIFAGFYSKDAILEALWGSGTLFSRTAYITAILSAFLTAAYTYRMVSLTFYGSYRGSKDSLIKEPPLVMTIPNGFLSLGAIFSGFLLSKYFMGQEAWLSTSVSLGVQSSILSKGMENLGFFKHTPLFLCVVAAGLILKMYHFTLGESVIFSKSWVRVVQKFLHKKWYVDYLYFNYLVEPFLTFSQVTALKVDREGIDRFGPRGVQFIVGRLAENLRKVHTGNLTTYVFIMIISWGGIMLYGMHLFWKGGTLS